MRPLVSTSKGGLIPENLQKKGPWALSSVHLKRYCSGAWLQILAEVKNVLRFKSLFSFFSSYGLDGISKINLILLLCTVKHTVAIWKWSNHFIQKWQKIKCNLEVENDYHNIAVSHCYQVNECSSKILVIIGGAYFLKHFY